jgi:shikimate kinase
VSRSIALAGMMGAGKSTVARLLAERLGRGLADTDVEIEQHVGMPIPRIFLTKGEAWFRSAEHQVIREVARFDDLVIALGGGAVLDDANVAELLLTGVVVYLEAPAEVLLERLRDEADGRPLLAGDLEETVRSTLAARAPRYREAADLVVDASAPPDAVVDEIVVAATAMRDVLTPSEHEQVMR